MTRTGPKPLPPGFLGGLLRGLGYPLEAMSFIRRHRLWGLSMWPALVNLLLLIVVVVLAFWWFLPWLEAAEQWLEPTSDEGLWNTILGGLAAFASVLMWILVPVAVVVLGSAFVVLVGQAVASPFLDVLSERVETLVLGTEPAPFTWGRTVRSVTVAIADIVWTVVFFVAVNIPLLLVNIVPVLGSAANAVLSFCFAALLLSQEFVGLSLARRFVSYPGRWSVIWGNKGLGLGCGSTIMALFVVPGLNVLLLPLASVGGTLLYCDLKAAGRAGAGAAEA
jgi:CysZ protein